MKVQRTAMALIVVFLVFYLLYVGQALLLPLVIAGAIAYLINILAHTICMFRFKGASIPHVIAMGFAIAVILTSIGLIIQLITLNIASVIEEVPKYQENLGKLTKKIYGLFGVEEAPNIQQILSSIDFRSYLQDFGGTVRSLLSRTGIIFVYLIFLLLEQRTFSSKIQALVSNPNRLEDVFALIEKIRSDIRTYIGIKVLTSAGTALLSYLVLSLVGVDFASFWAVLIFLLNFIPTIGSIIATAFPSILTLVQFDTLGPFIITASVLTGIQFCVGSLLEPRLMGSRLNLSPIVILLSLGLWGSIWGIPGMFLCVPITVVTVIICSYFPTTRSLAILLSGNGELSIGPRSKKDET
ncbi:MAG: putative PurR-regulated permease PerM [Lentimonas sp.]|jgi:predicted PurR-regulated permease PerM